MRESLDWLLRDGRPPVGALVPETRQLHAHPHAAHPPPRPRPRSLSPAVRCSTHCTPRFFFSSPPSVLETVRLPRCRWQHSWPVSHAADILAPRIPGQVTPRPPGPALTSWILRFPVAARRRPTTKSKTRDAHFVAVTTHGSESLPLPARPLPRGPVVHHHVSQRAQQCRSHTGLSGRPRRGRWLV